ncbi:MAG TPA: DUF4193 family protein [Actinomycetota bacterium]|nr:DUF4193 family protein [Actinomycetota bacterium]
MVYVSPTNTTGAGVAEDEELQTDESAVETSLEELLQRKERRLEGADEEDDDDALIEAMEGPDGPSETLAVKVIPPQPTEFTCQKCFLLKHQTQLKDKKRQLCRDCA